MKDKNKRSKLDDEIKKVDIQPFVRKDRNIVAVKLVVQRRTDGILDLLKIGGDFALTVDHDGYINEIVVVVGNNMKLSFSETNEKRDIFQQVKVGLTQLEIPPLEILKQ